MGALTHRDLMNTMAGHGFTKIYSARDHYEFVTEADRTGTIDSMIADYQPGHNSFRCVLTHNGKTNVFQAASHSELRSGLAPLCAHKRFLDRMS